MRFSSEGCRLWSDACSSVFLLVAGVCLQERLWDSGSDGVQSAVEVSGAHVLSCDVLLQRLQSRFSAHSCDLTHTEHTHIHS